MPATILQLIGLVLVVIAGFALSVPAGIAAIGAVCVYVGLAVEDVDA